MAMGRRLLGWLARARPETLRSRVGRLETFRTYTIGRMGAIELLLAKPIDMDRLAGKKEATLRNLDIADYGHSQGHHLDKRLKELEKRVAVMEKPLPSEASDA